MNHRLSLPLTIVYSLIVWLTLMVPLSIAVFWPASAWFYVATIHVNDAKYGEPVTMLVDRKISRPFNGQFFVSIHRWETNGPVAFCKTRGGPWDYLTRSMYPNPLTLAWWVEYKPDAPWAEAYAKCSRLPPGKYSMTTRWLINSEWMLIEKTVSATSNIFTIEPP